MQAIGRQPQRVPDGAPVHHERHRPEQTTLYHLVQQNAASFIAHTEASTGSELPRFVKDEFDSFLECGILAHGFLRLAAANAATTGCLPSATGAAGSACGEARAACRTSADPSLDDARAVRDQPQRHKNHFSVEDVGGLYTSMP